MIPKILHFFPDTNLSKDKLNVLTERYRNIYFDCNFIYWSEEGCKEFVKTIFPEYLTLFNKNVKNDYGNQLKKYLILLHYGGIYFDSDLFPLRSITGLLPEKNTLLTFEPSENLGFYSHTKLVSDTFLACTEQNLFVKSIVENLVSLALGIENNSNRAYNFKSLIITAYNNYLNKSEIIVIRSYYFQPLTKKQLNNFDESLFDKIKYAYSARLFDQNISETSAANKINNILLKFKTNISEDLPLISCMCISNNSEDFVRRCIKSFNDQIYENKELVIICEETSKAYSFLSNIKQDNIYVYDETDKNEKKSLGRLRNIAVSMSKGRYVTQWDDDDIYDPHRIYEQYIFMVRQGCDGCMVDQVTIFDKIYKKYSLSKKRTWEGSIIFDKNLSISSSILYPELSKGEDTPFVDNYKSKFKIGLLSDPFLYLYVTHENNTFSYDHHTQLIKTYLKVFKTYLNSNNQNLNYFKSFNF